MSPCFPFEIGGAARLDLSRATYDRTSSPERRAAWPEMPRSDYDDETFDRLTSEVSPFQDDQWAVWSES